MADWVKVAPIRAAFEQSGLTATELGYAVGWTCTRRSGRQAGGKFADVKKVKKVMSQEKTHAHIAEPLVRVLGVDPVDVGL